MIDLYTDFLKSFSDYLIKGMFISLLLIIVIKLLSKNKIEIVLSIQIIRWIIIAYSFGCLINSILMLIFPPSEKYAFLERATGPYAWSYWLMSSMNTIFPLILLNNKIGKKFYFILIISLLMNIGWLFESFVVHVSNLQNNFTTENYNPFLPNSIEKSIIMNGIAFGVVLLIIENLQRNSRKTEIVSKK